MPSDHTGHRKRLKDQFQAAGLEGMADYRVLELLLFYARPQCDVVPVAERLLEEFGTLTNVFQATYDQLVAVDGIGPNAAVLFRLIPALSARLMAEQQDNSRKIDDMRQVKELLEPCFYTAHTEEFYVICLDSGNRLLNVRKLGEGIVNQVQVVCRRVMEMAMACNASYLVLAHNHLSGDALPSTADVSATMQVMELMEKVGIHVLDHYIYCVGDFVSMRGAGYLDGRGGPASPRRHERF